jgi:hypothetical protein
LRASLITLVSINNISGHPWILLALKIGVHAYIRHGGQDLAQFSFLAAPMGPGPLLEGLQDAVINASALIARLSTQGF